MFTLPFLSNIFRRSNPENIKNNGDLDVSNKNHWVIQSLSNQNAVDPKTAMQISAVFACVRVIAETLASLPLIIYRRVSDDRREPAKNHPLYSMLHDIGPNAWQSAPEFWENCIGINALRGNAYNYKVFNNSGKLIGLMPLNPDNIAMKIDIADFRNPEIVYVYKTLSGETFDLPANDVWHLKGISSDGFEGLSPLRLAANSMNLSAASESHGNTFFQNGAKPSGVASYPGRLKEDAYERLRSSISERISGSNKFKVLLLEEGATWSQIGLSNEDSQFLQTRQFQVEDIARFFRVPTILIGHPDKSSTYASAEQFMISFVKHTIRPWLVRVEKSISKHLLSIRDQKRYYAEFKVDALLRGDTKTRYQAYETGIRSTWLSPNEARRMENLPPREGGDVYENPNVAAKESQQRGDKPSNPSGLVPFKGGEND